MNFLRSTIVLAFALLLSTSADALLFRAYLASDGNDVNPCTLASPCRLLPAALAVVADGGEIWMLDSANYNTATVTIAKSVTILAVPGVVGSVVSSSGPALSITTAGLKIALRNLVIAPLVGGGGTDGVRLWAASTLSVEGCVFANLPGNGVYVLGTGAEARTGNSIFRNVSNKAVDVENGGTADILASQFINIGAAGVIAHAPGAAARPWSRVSASKVRNSASAGVISDSSAAGQTNVTVSDSVVTGSAIGVEAYSDAASGTSRLYVTRSTLSGNSLAMASVVNAALASATVVVSGSMIVNNASSYQQQGAGATIRSLVNNHITDNGGSTGTLPTESLQ